MGRDDRREEARFERKRRYETALKAKGYLAAFLGPRKEIALRELMDAPPALGELLAARERLRAVLDLETAFTADLEAGRETDNAREGE